MGVREVPLGSDRGPRVDRYFRAASSRPGVAWCAAFVSFVAREAGSRSAAQAGHRRAWRRCAGSAAASGSPPGWRDPRPGDVALYPSSHTGFVARVGRLGRLWMVDGNYTNSVSYHAVSSSPAPTCDCRRSAGTASTAWARSSWPASAAARRDRVPDAAVQRDVLGAVGADVQDRRALGSPRGRRAARRRCATGTWRRAVELGGPGEVQAGRRGDVLLEDVGLGGDGQEVEDPAAAVVEQPRSSAGCRSRVPASRPPRSWASATSPISSTTGPSRAAATP